MKLLAAVILTLAIPGLAQQPITWRFDNLARIGGAQVATIGNPQVVETPIGKAIHFEGHGNPNPTDPERQPHRRRALSQHRATLRRRHLYL